MNTSTLFIRSIVVAFIGLAFVFVPLALVRAETYVPPSGPPPSFNANPPIHTGSTGQAKFYLGDLPPHTIGAFSLVSDVVTTVLATTFDLISENVSARQFGILATAFCLGEPGAIQDAEANPNTWWFNPEFDCINFQDGWGGLGEGGADLPDGSDWNQMLWWDLATSSWLPLGGVKITSAPTLTTLFLGNQTDANIPDGRLYVDGGDLGGFQVRANNGHFLNLNANGIKVQSTDFELKLENGNQPIGAVPVTLDADGTLAWLSADELGGFPDEAEQSQIWYWNSDLGDGGEWALSGNGAGFDGSSFVVNYGIGGSIIFENSEDNCDPGSVLKMGIFEFNPNVTDEKVRCENGLRVAGNSPDETTVFVESLSHDFDSRVVCAGPEGDLNLCDNLSTGTWQQDTEGTYDFEVPFGVYELTVTLIGGGGGGGAGGMGRSLNLVHPAEAQDDIMGGGGGGGGGGRGEIITEVVAVEPGQIYEVTVGDGGIGGCPERRWYQNEEECGNLNNIWNENIHGKGRNGEPSLFICDNDDCDENISLIADGGMGGGTGGSLWGFYDVDHDCNEDNEADDLLDWLVCVNDTNVVGGGGGQNADGNLTAQNGFWGSVFYEGIDFYYEDFGGIDYLNGSLCYRLAYPGGGGGSGSDGANGGVGGGFFSNGPCGNWDSGSSAWGTNGSSGVGAGHGGGGGGGGNSESPNNQQNGSGTYAYGGFGGRGADGKVIIEW